MILHLFFTLIIGTDISCRHARHLLILINPAGSAALAWQALRTALTHESPLQPVMTLTDNDVFEAARFHAGAVMLLRKEVLMTATPNDQLLVDESCAAAKRTYNLSPSLGAGEGELHLAYGPNMLYRDSIYWGVITPGKDQLAFMTIPAIALTMKNGTLKKARKSAMRPGCDRFVVGSVAHHQLPAKLQGEELVRVNAVQFFASQPADQRAKPRSTWTGLRLALGAAGA